MDDWDIGETGPAADWESYTNWEDYTSNLPLFDPYSGGSSGSDSGSSGGLLDSIGGWFGKAVDAYGRVEVAKINAKNPFSPPYASTTYGRQPNAATWDIRNIGGTMQRPAVLSSGTVMIGAALLIGLLVYSIVKK